MYNVKELREKLVDKILGLGIDTSFKESPAFSSIVAKIDTLIGQMNMFEAAEKVAVIEEANHIEFTWTSPITNTKYSMKIVCSSPTEFNMITTGLKSMDF